MQKHRHGPLVRRGCLLQPHVALERFLGFVLVHAPPGARCKGRSPGGLLALAARLSSAPGLAWAGLLKPMPRQARETWSCLSCWTSVPPGSKAHGARGHGAVLPLASSAGALAQHLPTTAVGLPVPTKADESECLGEAELRALRALCTSACAGKPPGAIQLAAGCQPPCLPHAPVECHFGRRTCSSTAAGTMLAVLMHEVAWSSTASCRVVFSSRFCQECACGVGRLPSVGSRGACLKIIARLVSRRAVL